MKNLHPTRPAILIPLYIYPDPGAWDILYEAIVGLPAQTFVIIINPHNGPGAGSEPDEHYAREIARLNSYHNVCMVGYVATSWGKRKLEAVLEDVSKYEGWSQNGSALGLAVQGIFFDETPSVYDPNSAELLRAAHAAVRSTPAFGPMHMVADNPGTMPDERYLEGSDISIVFEGSYEVFRTHDVEAAMRTLSTSLKAADPGCNGDMAGGTKLACILHSVPKEVAGNGMCELVTELKELAGYIYVVDLAVDYYCSIGSCWKTFAAEMAQ